MKAENPFWYLVPPLAGLRVLVVGMGRSGQAAARFCLREEAVVTCTDLRGDAPEVPGCRMILGRHEREAFVHADIIVISPGVPATQPDVVAARAAGVPVVGELALAASRIDVPILAITGTNGKSTVTWFIGQLLEAAGHHPFVGGNLGNPLAGAFGDDGSFSYDFVVAEVSSYQMEWPGTFAPAAAIILNLTPDHLARHGTIENYGAFKCRVFERMGPDAAAILPFGDPLLARLAVGPGGRRLWLGATPGAEIDGEQVLLDLGHGPESVSLAGFQVPGRHNRLNAAAALLMVRAVGVPVEDLHPEVLTALHHRMQPVADVNGILWINDSKATNVAAAKVGLGGLDRSLVVLLGGEGKAGDDYAELRSVLLKARAVICFGLDGPRIADALESSAVGDHPLPMHRVRGMADAVTLARSLAQPGDAVVLSPACASFDEFRNFEHRGDVFRQLAEMRQ